MQGQNVVRVLEQHGRRGADETDEASTNRISEQSGWVTLSPLRLAQRGRPER